MMIRTRLCDELGIEHPIFGAGMANVSLGELTAAVSDAGGCGVLGATFLTPGQLREEIRVVRRLTSKPFGVDLLMPDRLPKDSGSVQRPPLPPFLQELGKVAESFPEAPSRPVLTDQLVREQFAVVVEERVPVFASGLGTPEWMVADARAHGIKVMALVGNVKQALAVEKLGVDYIVAQGHEAGGHTGRIGTMVLVPAVVDAVKVPVVAAGGIGDGRGVAASLMLGAVGAWIGSRFLATHEARLPDRVKARLVAIDEEGTVVTKAYTGKPTRVLRNRYTDAWIGNEHHLQRMPFQALMVEPIVSRAKASGDLEIANWPTGQVTGIVREIRSARDVVAEIVNETTHLLSASRTP